MTIDDQSFYNVYITDAQEEISIWWIDSSL